MEPVSREVFKEKFGFVVDEFWSDMRMQCQDCSPLEVWELVDGYGLIGLRDWLRELKEISRDYLFVYNSLPYFIGKGFTTVAELDDFLDCATGEDKNDAGIV